jgi:tRNA pseudouridine55 synthase
VTNGVETRHSGFAIIDKPVGTTSFSVLSSLGRRLGRDTKSGHAGTLDSFASGVLVCLFGRYTRLSDYFMGTRKGYEADILFGEETDTLDPSGKVIAHGPIPSLDALEAVLGGFRGDIMQAPPVYSAVHIDGQRAYERARKGQDVRPVPRPVTIHDLNLLSYDNGVARIGVSCSKGTYIRSLGRDIALACGSRGRLSALRRTFSGPFRVEDATGVDHFGTDSIMTLDESHAKDLGLGAMRLSDEEARVFLHGLPLFRLASFSALDARSPLAVFDKDARLLGIVTRRESTWQYAFVMGDE